MIRRNKIPEDLEQVIVNAWHKTKYPTIIGFARRYNVDRSTMTRLCKRNGLTWEYSHLSAEQRDWQDKIQTLQDAIAPKLIHRPSLKFRGDAMISGDYHTPAVDIEMVKQLVEQARQFKLKRLFIIGDFFNLDLLGYYASKMGGNNEVVKMEDELFIGRQVLEVLTNQFSSVIYLMGNHEARFRQVVRNGLTFEIVHDWLKTKNLHFIDNYWCYLDGIRLTHPKSYSQIKLSVAMRLCDKYNCDVVQAHGHFSSMGYSRGGYRAVDLGCMCDSERIAYMNKGDTTHPIWNQGFGIYKDGQLYMRSWGFGLKRL